MRTLASTVGIAPRVLQAVLDVNADQPLSVLRPLLEAFGDDSRGRSVLLLGLAFKPGTDDVRESASLRMACHLAGLGVRVLAHDPIAAANATAAVAPGVFTVVENWREAITGADGVILATRWPEYEALATTPGLLDGKVFLDARRMFAPGTFPRARHVAVGYTPAAGHPATRKAHA